MWQLRIWLKSNLVETQVCSRTPTKDQSCRKKEVQLLLLLPRRSANSAVLSQKRFRDFVLDILSSITMGFTVFTLNYAAKERVGISFTYVNPYTSYCCRSISPEYTHT